MSKKKALSELTDRELLELTDEAIRRIPIVMDGMLIRYLWRQYAKAKSIDPESIQANPMSNRVKVLHGI